MDTQSELIKGPGKKPTASAPLCCGTPMEYRPRGARWIVVCPNCANWGANPADAPKHKPTR